MRSSLGTVVAGLICALIGIGAWASAVKADTGTSVGGSSSPLIAQLVVPSVQMLDGGQQVQNAREAKVASPEEVAASEGSQTAYEGLSAPEAATLAAEDFPEAIDKPGGGPPLLPAGDTITGFVGDTVAQVDLGHGQQGVLESSAPIALETSSGQHVPIDLGLKESGTGFEPTVPLVAMKIPKRLTDGVSLTSIDVSLTPTGGTGTQVAGADGSIDGTSVFYGDTQIDTDVAIKPTTFGFDMQSVLRSVRSPEQLHFKVSVPKGAELVQAGNGLGPVRVQLDGQVIARVGVPVASDAAGTAVPASMRLVGDILTVTVNHLAGAYRYPIMVDPTVGDATLLGSGTASNWKVGSTNPSVFHFAEVNERELTDTAEGSHNKFEWGEFAYDTQGASRIYGFGSATFGWNAAGPPESQDRNYLYIMNKSNEPEESLMLPGYYSIVNHTLCAKATCSPASGSAGNAAIYQQYVQTSGSEAFEGIIVESFISISQEAGPSSSMDTADPSLNGLPNASTGQWVNPALSHAVIAVTATDPGIGIYKATVTSPQELPYLNPFKVDYQPESGCSGVQCYQCWNVTSRCEAGTRPDGLPISSGGPLTFGLEVPEAGEWHGWLPDGEDTVTVADENATGAKSTATGVVRIDTAAPTGISFHGLPSGNEIGEGSYHVSVEATDGAGTTPSSGVAQMTLMIDGREVGKPNGACTWISGPCTAKGEWLLQAAEYGSGAHALTAIVTDAAGNTASQTITLTIHQPTPIPTGPGVVNPQSGEFRMQARDVTVAGLNVTRDYNSEHLNNEEPGPLGAQWGVSLTDSERMTEEPNGNIVLTEASGGTTTFTNNGSGFTSPKGDSNITLTATSEGYTLRNAAAATETAFTQPENSAFATPTYAGSIGIPGVGNGALKEPRSVAVDSKGNLWVADAANHRVEEFDSGGKYVTQFGSEGTGTGQFNQPFAIAIDSKSNIWVTDYYNHRIEKFGPKGEYITTTPTSGSGYLTEPDGIAVDAKDNLWVADAGNNRLVEFTEYGEYMKVVGSPGSGNGQFNRPLGIAIDSKSNVWVTDSLNHRVQEFNENGEYQKQFGSQGSGNGQFEGGIGIQADAKGNVWVGDMTLDRIQEFNEKGEFLTKFGAPGSGPGQFESVHFFALTGKGTVWVADMNNARVQKWTHAVWMPTISNGPVATDRMTYSYTTVLVNGKSVTEPKEALAPVPAGVSCAGEVSELKRGCRALSFNYATSNTASGEGPSEWGDYQGRLTRVYFTAWNAEASAMKTVTVAQYAYDTQARLRAVWDPRVSPALKTDYGYDTEGHLTAVTPPGQQPWTINYGTLANNAVPGRLLSTARAGVSTAVWTGEALKNTTVPSLSSSEATVGAQLTATSPGTWTGGAVSYSYQWLDCSVNGGIGATGGCIPIVGAHAPTYTPISSDRGYGLVVEVSATNPAGTVAARSATTSVIPTGIVRYSSSFGSLGSGSGQLHTPAGTAVDSAGNVWVVDGTNNRMEEFTASGTFVRMFGSSGSGPGEFSVPEDVAISPVTGDLYVTDYGNNRVQEFTPQGVYALAFGSYGSGNGQFNGPKGLSIDSSGHVWVADRANNRVEEFTEDGLYLAQFGTAGTGNGQFKLANSVVACEGGIYAIDYEGQRVEEFTTTGSYVTKFGSAGTGNGQFTQIARIACDTTRHLLYVTDKSANRIEVFNLGGDYIGTFGTSGTSAGQFSAPLGMSVSASGRAYIADSANNRVQEWTAPYVMYSTSFGSSGTGNGQFKTPIAIAVDASKNVWVDDTVNHRIQEFSSTGSFTRAFGSAGTGNGQFEVSQGMAISPTNGHVYASDSTNNRVQEFTATGEFVRSFGSAGTGNGQFKEPKGMTVDSSGNVWVADSANNRVEEFSSTGTYSKQFGASGSGNGQFAGTNDVSYCGEALYVADYGNQRVEKFSTAGAYQAQFGSTGTNNGQFTQISRMGCDSTNKLLYVSDKGANRVEVFNLSGEFVGAFGSGGSGSSQLSGPYGIAINSSGTVYVADGSNNRITEWVPFGLSTEPVQNPASQGTTSVTTVDYNVPLSGTGLPTMTEGEVAKWAQTDVPLEAAAVFPPDELQGWPATDYKRATLYYFDARGRTVNVATPSGGIATSEYNEKNDVVRSLSADNRATALKETEPKEAAKLLDTQSEYNSEGTELLSTLGPRHTVKLKSGTEVQARSHTLYSYDEGAPSEGGPFRLVTKTTQGAQIEGESEQDVRTTTTSYSGQENLGWSLRKPTSVTVDPSGLKITHTTIYEPATGNVVETRAPSATVPATFASTIKPWTTTSKEWFNPMGVAIDSSGNIWVVEPKHNEVQEFNSSGESLLKVGTEGTGNAQFKEPQSIAIDKEGNLWITDTANSRVQELSATGTFVRAFGTKGTGTSQFKSPQGIAMDAAGHVWVADAGNNRVQEFSATGEYIRQFGSEGTGNGQFKSGLLGTAIGMWIAIDAEGHPWVSDAGDNRVQEFSTEGAYITQFGTKGTGNGQFEKPQGITIDGSGHLWICDYGNYRIEKFSHEGTYLSQFGTKGANNGQFKTPKDIALDSTGHPWVTDAENHRLQRLSETGEYISQISAEGPVEEKIATSAPVTVDPKGNVWVTDPTNNRVEKFNENGEFVSQFGTEGTGNSQFKSPGWLAADTKGNIWVVDKTNNRVEEFNEKSEYVAQAGSEGTGNGQFKEPTGIATDAKGNVWVTDTGNNRVQELNEKAEYVAQFGSEGSGNGQFKAPAGIATGPGGTLWIADSTNNRIERFNEKNEYVSQFGHEGTGNGQFKTPKGIVLDSKGSLWVTDYSNSRVQQFTETGSYLAQFKTKNLGATSISADGKGNLWVSTLVSAALEKWLSKNGNTASTVYYSAEANTAYPACGEHPEWANLLCEKLPGKQPETPGLPALPVSTVTGYNMLLEPLTVKSTSGAATRTTTNTYDEAGRPLTNETTSTVGAALPKLTDKYDAKTGAANEQSTTTGGETLSLKNTVNMLGQVTSYVDADGNTTKYEYEGEEHYKGASEKDGRLKHIDDGKGTQTYTYDETTGALKELADAQGTNNLTFTASYDIEGNMIREGYPNGMNANYTANASGETTGISYEKVTHCSEKCVWFTDTAVPSIHGQWLSQQSTLAAEKYSYDEAGRLTQTQETPAEEGCTTRIYGYDEETNRTSLTTRLPGTGGACATEGGTIQTHTYDTASRLTDTGVSYNAFGETTKLPAGDAGGTELTSSFYVDGQLEGQTQNGQTIGYQLDPEDRTRKTIDTGTVNSTITSHYTGPGDSPSWTVEPTSGHWTRYVKGIGGLVAIEKDTTEPVLELTDVQGNVVASAPVSETATKLAHSEQSSEYGVPTSTKPEKYSWLGADQRATELPSGVVAMGARSYVPEIGRFLQTDSVEGGSANAYAYTYGDPINSSDPSGAFTEGLSEEDTAAGNVSAEKNLAEERAAKTEAETKASSSCPIASMCVMPEEEGIPMFTWASGGSAGDTAFTADLLKALPIAAEVGACDIMAVSNRHNPQNAYYFNKKTYAHCQYLYRHNGDDPAAIVNRGRSGFSISFNMPLFRDLACAAVGVGITYATVGTVTVVAAVAGATSGLACATIKVKV